MCSTLMFDFSICSCNAEHVVLRHASESRRVQLSEPLAEGTRNSSGGGGASLTHVLHPYMHASMLFHSLIWHSCVRLISDCPLHVHALIVLVVGEQVSHEAKRPSGSRKSGADLDREINVALFDCLPILLRVSGCWIAFRIVGLFAVWCAGVLHNFGFEESEDPSCETCSEEIDNEEVRGAGEACPITRPAGENEGTARCPSCEPLQNDEAEIRSSIKSDLESETTRGSEASTIPP
jgi:hypothetical protein